MRSPGQWRRARRYGRHAAILHTLIVHTLATPHGNLTSWDIAEALGRIHYRVRRDLDRLRRAGLVDARWTMPGVLTYQLTNQPADGPGSTAGTPRYLATGRDYRKGPWWTTTA